MRKLLKRLFLEQYIQAKPHFILATSFSVVNLYFRGVAKVVSRQFRVLETVGSSPAASTKKTVFDGLFFILSKPARTRTHLAHLHYVSTWFVTDIC